MANIVIDPAIVTIPSDTTSREDVERWLGHLMIWLNEALTGPFTWLHYRAATELLQAYSQFPDFQQLKRLQQKYRLDVNVSQIARRIDSFFREDSFDLETHLNSLEYAADFAKDTTVVEPDQFIARSPEYLHNGFSALLANCCICKYIKQSFGQNLHIATLALDGGLKELTVSVVVLDVLPDNAIANKPKDMPPVYQIHPVRKSKTADSPQLVREGDYAKAWRLMLQKYRAGWRLHYWQISTPDGDIIEFANVGKESEREIY